MKKSRFLVALLVVAALAVVAPMAVFAAGPQVLIEGEAVHFQGQGPVIVDGRTLVPVRGVFEQLGYYVDWDEATRTVIISGAAMELMFITIDSHVFTAFDIEFELDVPAQIIGGSTMVPLRYPLQAIGFHLGWDAAANAVLISRDPIEVTETMSPAEHFALNFAMVQSWLITNRGAFEAAGEIEFFAHFADLDIDALLHTSLDDVQFDFWAGLDIPPMHITMPVGIVFGHDTVTLAQIEGIFGDTVFETWEGDIFGSFDDINFVFSREVDGGFTFVLVMFSQA